MTDPNTIWAETLLILRRQMTQATYDAHLAQTTVHTAANGCYEIIVPNQASREWLANRLKGTIERALGSIIDNRDIKISFILAQNSSSPKLSAPNHPPETAHPPTLTNENNVAQAVVKTDLIGAYFGKGTLGYDSIPHEVELYKMPVLGAAYLLWRNLIAEDKRSLADITPNYWTPVMRYSLNELAARLNRKHPRYVSGDALECAYSRQCRLQEQPLRRPEDCCGSEHYSLLWFKPQNEGGFKCLHWSEGVLETLQRARLIRIERQASGYKPALQVWRLPTLLTPFQFAGLTDELQTDYRNYIERHGPRFGLDNFEEWLTIEEDYLEPLLPGYERSQVKNDWRAHTKERFLRNAVVNPKKPG